LHKDYEHRNQTTFDKLSAGMPELSQGLRDRARGFLFLRKNQSACANVLPGVQIDTTLDVLQRNKFV